MPVIEQLLKESNDEFSFTFKRGESLERKANKIPNQPGIMLVFCKKTSSVFDIDLEYTINGNEYVLCNYGMSSGTGNQQGLQKYINNVVDYNGGYIDREEFWELFMKKNNIDELVIRCILLTNPNEMKKKITKSLVKITYDVNKKKDIKSPIKPLMKLKAVKL